jgi:sugar O-acyltransferase (sialic acid O-acetyltransferase NeuD family)
MADEVVKQLVMLGAGGHAKVLLSLLRAAGLQLVGVCDPRFDGGSERQWRGVPILGGDAALASLDPARVHLVNAVGQVVGKVARRELFEQMRVRGFRFATLVHPCAVVDETASLAEGVQVMAGAVIQADARIGENSIVNTCASIDHDCVVAANVHVAPGVTICGGARIGDEAFIGTGATVLPGVVVGPRAVLGAGTTLTRDLAAGRMLLGAAAREQNASEKSGSDR